MIVFINTPQGNFGNTVIAGHQRSFLSYGGLPFPLNINPVDPGIKNISGITELRNLSGESEIKNLSGITEIRVIKN